MKHLLFILIATICFSCKPTESLKPQSSETLVIYMAADNDLKGNALLNVYDMVEGIKEDQKVVVFMDKGDKSSYLMELNKENGTAIHRQVVKQYPDQNSADSHTLHQVLKAVIERYPSQQYGLILWSHGTSWFPAPKPKTKSFGVDKQSTMEIDDLATALPTKFKYILFDACLMGSVEVASELQNNTDYLIASPTDILTTGMPYKKILPILLNTQQTVEKRLKEVCRTYIKHYKQKEGKMQSASIALYNLNNINMVQTVMQQIITNDPNMKVKAAKVQKLHKDADCYDLFDMVQKNYGSNAATQMNSALSSFILFHNHTDKFQENLSLESVHGINCYIPVDPNTYYPEFYSNLQWCKITQYNKAIF
ncbi:clostripain-related cysteine peptidase [Prolixibacteraceae bacterium]|nr:clostripain-related cysteine peptidase [Prolixibacteraceae bacterium]